MFYDKSKRTDSSGLLPEKCCTYKNKKQKPKQPVEMPSKSVWTQISYVILSHLVQWL